ncbi:MAG: methyltransferase [Candidatus Nanopelagicaceae bacterium]
MKRSIEDALSEAAIRIRSDDFVRAIFTGSRKTKKPQYSRIDLRPVEIKGHVLIQSVTHDGTKDFTKNYEVNAPEINSILDSGFSNLIIESMTESYQIQITKKEEAITGIGKTRLERVTGHDREKERLLPESHPIFAALELSDTSGRIKASKRDKFIQIDQLLRSVEEVLSNRAQGDRLKVIDLASGSGALTLAVHAFLAGRFEVTTEGIERNPELVDKANQIAKVAGLTGISFTRTDIRSAAVNAPDLVLALHACDTATDDAIDLVIKAKAKCALIVPCCHQTRSDSIRSKANEIPAFGHDGILDERFLDLLTDAARAERLRAENYGVEVIEFVADEHTARNLLIRARLR